MIFRSKLPEYQIWLKMRSRCMKKTATDYARYGGRGIDVCAQWSDFDVFLSDMGPRPTASHSLDRIDNDGPYSPQNCKWATLNEQANNKRSSHFVQYLGRDMTIAQAVAEAGNRVTRENARCRIANGWNVKDAVETPPLFRRDPQTRRVVGAHQTFASTQKG